MSLDTERPKVYLESGELIGMCCVSGLTSKNGWRTEDCCKESGEQKFELSEQKFRKSLMKRGLNAPARCLTLNAKR